MHKSLLAHIACNFISEYENVANSSIAYLLNKYDSAQNALKIVLDVDEVPTRYVTELSTVSNGRPDITGLDAKGNKSIIIEGKFWANLTENQPVNYLKEMPDHGRMLFLAPDKRLSSLGAEIEKRISLSETRVEVCSWNRFLELVEKENNKNINHHLTSDLIQINALCQKMDSEGMPPLSESDLDPMNGRIATQLSDVVNECNALLRNWDHSNFNRLKTTSSQYGHGFYFLGYNYGCYLHFDANKWFLRENHTPIWLAIYDGEWDESEVINHELHNYDAVNSHGMDYGIILRKGMDKNQAINHIVDSTKKVLTHLVKRQIA